MLELEDPFLLDTATVSEYQKSGRRLTVNFWMDTFCIPIEPQLQGLRNRCIGQMRRIYKSAAAVVTLDTDLQRLSSDAKPTEVLGRLFSCN